MVRGRAGRAAEARGAGSQRAAQGKGVRGKHGAEGFSHSHTCSESGLSEAQDPTFFQGKDDRPRDSDKMTVSPPGSEFSGAQISQ